MKLTLPEQSKIFSYYMKHPIEVSEAYISPIPKEIRGKEDGSPSFSIFYNKAGDTLLFKDHGGAKANERSYNKKKLVGDCLVFMTLVDPDIKSHKQALWFYHREIKNAVIEYTEVKKGRRKRNKTAPAVLHRKTRFTQYELNYWQQYNICRKQLIQEYIYGSDGIKIQDGYIFKSSSDYPAFVYELNPDKYLRTCQIYNPNCPKELKQKWRLWTDKDSVSQTYHTTLPESGDVFILGSGKKDMMCIKNSGYCSDAPLGETNRFRFLSKYKEYDARFNEKYILFDGDKPGIQYAKMMLYDIKKIDRQTTWKVININYPKGCKDVADIVKLYGQDTLTKILKTIIR